MFVILPALAWTPELPAGDDGSRQVAAPVVVWSTSVGGALGPNTQLIVAREQVAVGTGHGGVRPELLAGLSLVSVATGEVLRRVDFGQQPETVRVTALDDGWATHDADAALRRFTDDGELSWSTSFPHTGSSLPCAPLPYGAELFAQQSGLFAADASGAPRAVLREAVNAPCSRVDVDGDGTHEWLLGTEPMELWRAGATERLWSVDTSPREQQHHHILGDLHPHEGPEVGVVTALGRLVIRSARDGSELQEIYLGAPGGGSRPAWASWYPDAGCYLAAADNGDTSVHCRNEEGLRWRRSVRGALVTARPLVADLDGRPGAEALIATHDGELLALDAQGRTVWAWRSEQPLVATPLIGDLVGDARLEILVPGRWGQLTLLSTQGLGPPAVSGGPEDASWP